MKVGEEKWIDIGVDKWFDKRVDKYIIKVEGLNLVEDSLLVIIL